MIRDREIIPLEWQVSRIPDLSREPDGFVKASVPGAAQLDIANAGGFPDYRIGDNYKLYSEFEDSCFAYRAGFKRQSCNDGEIWFVSKGIDYHSIILLNGKKIHEQEGMFSPVEINITNLMEDDNCIQVLIDRVPKRKGCPDDRTQASESVKPAVSYGWDWHPRLIPSGIWDESGLQFRAASHLQSCDIGYELADDYSEAHLHLQAVCTNPEGKQLEWSLYDNEGNPILKSLHAAGPDVRMEADVMNPHLWWTHDHGVPYLYKSEIRLLSEDGRLLDISCGSIGFKRVRLVMNEGAWHEPKSFPKSRSNAPAQIELNGRRIFAKGTNWVAPEVFPGTIGPERYEELLDLAVSANFNILRCWGGCIINKDSFFELCDRKGILVWQEFPLACNCYPDDRHYLSVLEREAVSIIKRLRMHACIGIWCGGNELFNNWSGMTDQSYPLRLLNSLCYTLSPEIPFIATSPLTGMAHGHYLFRWEGMEIYQWMNSSHCTAYCEFGVPGVSPKHVLEKTIPETELFPAREGTAWESHNAFGAWDGDRNTWLAEPAITHYFGKASNLDELIERSSLLQGEGYKAIFEEARRQKPYCSMALNWCFNEPWPSAANNSLIVYPLEKKPAFDDVRQACRPVCASLRLSKYQWEENELFFCELWMLNDSFDDSSSYELELFVEDREGTEEAVLKWDTPKLKPNENIPGPVARVRLPSWDTDRFIVRVEVKDHPEMSSRYVLSYRRNQKKRGRVLSMNVTD